jgi:multisubunit Na+/H+ antiporter MnhE subunit
LYGLEFFFIAAFVWMMLAGQLSISPFNFIWGGVASNT